jgi:hypothetical protein
VKTNDERLEAIATNLKRSSEETHELRKLVEVDAQNIRALARVAEMHERRISHIEEGH